LYRSEETKACTVYIKGKKTLGLLTLLKDASSQDKKKKCPCNLGVKSSLRVSGEIGNCKSVTPCLQKFQTSEPPPSRLLPYLWSLNCIKSSFITVRVLIIYPSSDRSRCSSRCTRSVHTSTCRPSSAAADSEKENVSGMLLCNTMDGAN